ncbi:DNA polymerase III subunit delta [Flavobacterium aciduliphilum]|uniref:DNA polymerase III subunit delta n=1 Tax=Flavobacterium aciduliphilum TaxID=1101402 RepID=A0A328YKM6_9FLAO|nr:DNA polymerase III subunit delta [Flavobacterium aciduliphilum]RAR70686.1 DNA polymerase III delta subunit [Flavobacterium aciduliphilum]
MEEVIKIINDIKLGMVKPIYLFMGEEPYYIDKLTEYIENNVLTEDEKGFNQMVIYGRDTTIEELIGQAKRYPMLSEKQVVIVKEAQELSRTIEKLESYAEHPQPSTVLVLAYKYKTLDKRKKLYKQIDKTGVVFESKKLYENQVGSWIQRVLKGKDYGIDPKANAMLVEFLGNDLSRISNELDKLQIILPKGHTITPQDIEENIGFSKDFNVFELQNAIGSKNEVKAYQIAQYFADNPKDNPMVVTTSLVFSFFVKLLKYHGLKDKSQKNVMAALGISSYFFKDYERALQNYPMKKVSAIVATLRTIDVKSKGVGANALSNHDLLKEMLVKIFN